MDSKKIRKPKRSLRTILIFWFLLFSIVPIIFMTFYSVSKFSSSSEREIDHRINLSFKDFSEILENTGLEIKSIHEVHKKNKLLASYIDQQDKQSIIKLIYHWLEEEDLNEVSVFSYLGERLYSFRWNNQNEIQEVRSNTFKFLSEEFLESTKNKKTHYILDLIGKDTFSFSAFSKIIDGQGEIVGYLRESTYLKVSEVKSSRQMKDVEFLAYKPGFKINLATNKKLLGLSENYLRSKEERAKSLDLKVNDQSLIFRVKTYPWGDDKIKVALGVSNEESRALLTQITKAFITMLIGIVLLLVVLSFIISKILLEPLKELADVFLTKDPSQERIVLLQNSNTELGLLTEGTNELFSQVYESQQNLRENITELEEANIAIKGAQSKMVHTAKMASLGQLVAGVAHELNNPIGFIHSNMSHLKEYSESLITLIESLGNTNTELQKLKEKLEYSYIVEDLPKLIKSCEDGARRTRDIVLGLRNFSRLEEAQKKEIDLHKSLDATINLLSSEIKNRIHIDKNYGQLPKLLCYAGELNQVFMNVITNSAQAITHDKGEIKIQTLFKEEEQVIQIIIEDNGQGISEEYMEKLFDPFFTTKPPGVGTGLGLSISYGIIEKHKGKIQIDSKTGGPTKVVIELPLLLT